MNSSLTVTYSNISIIIVSNALQWIVVIVVIVVVVVVVVVWEVMSTGTTTMSLLITRLVSFKREEKILSNSLSVRGRGSSVLSPLRSDAIKVSQYFISLPQTDPTTFVVVDDDDPTTVVVVAVRR